MKKLFVEYPNLRSSTRKFDPCIAQQSPEERCSKCKVFVTSDRFLGQSRQIRLVGSQRKFPYVIIADTAGCNLRCWFCYSHHFWHPKKSCAPTFLSVDDLVNQIECKLERICQSEEKMDRKPFTSIRISGGEPIYADSDTVDPYESDKRIDYKLGISFWLGFFEKLDSLIGQLKADHRINIDLPP